MALYRGLAILTGIGNAVSSAGESVANSFGGAVGNSLGTLAVQAVASRFIPGWASWSTFLPSLASVGLSSWFEPPIPDKKPEIKDASDSFYGWTKFLFAR